MSEDRPEPTTSPVALFVFSNLREQKGGLTRAWLRRLALFHEAGWETHVATIHRQPEIDETLAAWRERGWLPPQTQVHHYQRRNRRLRPQWRRSTDDQFTRDDRIADWLDWLVGLLPGSLVFADSPVTYAPVAKMRNPYVGRVMTVHLAHRTTAAKARSSQRPVPERSRYQGPAGQPKLAGRFLPFAHGADAVVALTHRQAAHLAEDIPGVPIHVIPNIVDPAVPQAPSSDRGNATVVSIGRLDPLKRLDDALRAVALAGGRIPGLTLDVYGRGPDLDRLLALRDDLGLQSVVRFPGFTDDPYGVLARARASLMTSRREGFGLAVAESLAVGTPVVTYDVDYGPAELVVDGHNGRVVADGDVQGLADALVDVVTDDSTWSRLSTAGPPAVAHLTEGRVAAAWLELARDIAAKVPRPDPSLLVEDLRVRRAGLQVLGVAYATAHSGPAALRLAGASAALAPSGELPGPGEGTAVDPPGEGTERAELTVTPVTATMPWADLARVVPRQGPAEPDGAVRADQAFVEDLQPLTAVDVRGRPVAVHGPGIRTTVLPTVQGVLVARGRGDGGLAFTAVDRVVPVRVTPERVEAELDADVTVLSELPLFDAVLRPGRRDPVLSMTCRLPGLTFPEEGSLSIAARSAPPQVLGSVAIPGTQDETGRPGDAWRGSGTITWDPEALAAAGLPESVRLGLASGGRHVRWVGRLRGAGGPVPVVSSAGRWVMVTSSAGSLLLLRGRGARAWVGWTARRMLRRGSGI